MNLHQRATPWALYCHDSNNNLKTPHFVRTSDGTLWRAASNGYWIVAEKHISSDPRGATEHQFLRYLTTPMVVEATYSWDRMMTWATKDWRLPTEEERKEGHEFGGYVTLPGTFPLEKSGFYNRVIIAHLLSFFENAPVNIGFFTSESGQENVCSVLMLDQGPRRAFLMELYNPSNVSVFDDSEVQS